MKFRQLVEGFSGIEGTSSRNEKTEILAEILRKVEENELEAMVYLSLGRLKPLYDSLEFDLAEKMIVRTVAWSLGEREDLVWERYKTLGDLGDVLEKLKRKGKKEKVNSDDKSELSVGEVYERLVKVAEEEGSGSQERKVRRLGNLLQDLRPKEGKYVVRLVLGRLRLGFSDMTMLDALSWMEKGDKSDRDELERAFNVSTDLVRIAEVYKEDGLRGLSEIKVRLGVPIRPAKAERLGTLEEIAAKLEKFAVEPKMDGVRAQIHVYKGSDEEEEKGLFKSEEKVVVKVFSRGMEDVTKSFPDVVDAAKKLRGKVGQDLILDAEMIGFDFASKEFLPFQKTIKRKRKHKIEKTIEKVALKVFVFDVLYVNYGLLEKAFEKRREILEEVVKCSSGDKYKTEIVLTESEVVESADEADKYFRKYLDEGLEGMMCKKLESDYQAGARNFNWVKFKKVHDSKLLDTVDGVVLGYYKGRGKRQKFGMGAFLIGVLDGEDKFLTLAKIGTGLTDEQFESMYEKLKKLELAKKDERYEVDKSLNPDVWVRPELVVEIAADELTESPVHSAGYALRFPRLKRLRENKQVEQATSLKEVEELFESQR